MKHNKYLKLTAVILTVVTVLSLAGCKSAFTQSDFQNQSVNVTPYALSAPAPAAADPIPTEPAPVQEQTITLEEAKALVLQHLGLAQAEFTELDKDREDREYELEVIVGDTKYEFAIHMVTGTIREIDREPVRPVITPQPTAETALKAPAQQWEVLSPDRIRELVLAHFDVTEAQFLRVEKDRDDREYDVDVVIGDTVYELELDAYTGKIRKQEVEYRPATQSQTPSYLTPEQAKAAVTAHFSGRDVRFLECEPDEGNYELELLVDGVEYDIELSAKDGTILEIDRDD